MVFFHNSAHCKQTCNIREEEEGGEGRGREEIHISEEGEGDEWKEATSGRRGGKGRDFIDLEIFL